MTAKTTAPPTPPTPPDVDALDVLTRITTGSDLGAALVRAAIAEARLAAILGAG